MVVQQDIAFGLNGIKNGLNIRYINCNVIHCTGNARRLRGLVDLKEQTLEPQEDETLTVVKGSSKRLR